MAPKNTTEEFISKSIKVHGDKYVYTEVKYSGSHEILEIYDLLRRKSLLCCIVLVFALYDSDILDNDSFIALISVHITSLD
jgi:hypothetical protein